MTIDHNDNNNDAAIATDGDDSSSKHYICHSKLAYQHTTRTNNEMDMMATDGNHLCGMRGIQ